MRPGLLRRCAAAGGLLLSALAAPSGAAESRLDCRVFDLGPATSPHPTALCVGYSAGRPVIRTSSDRGRTWTERAATGTPEPADYLVSALVSPSYDTDKTLYLQYQSLGLFASTDGGATFLPADPQGGTEADDRISVVTSFGVGVAGAGPAIAIPGQGPAVYYAGQHLPVTGSGRQQERGFYQLGRGDGSVVLDVAQGVDAGLVAHAWISRCNEVLACPGGVELPAGLHFADLAVDPAPTASTAVALTDGTFPTVWASTDKGATFTRSTAFDKALAKYAKAYAGQTWAYSVAVMPGGRTWLVRAGTPRDALLLVSADAGRSWSRRAAPGWSQRVVAGPDGRLYGSGTYFQCSTDAGRSWRYRCA